MSEKLITIKDVALNNNCPECFSKEGLQLTFKQKFIETPFSKALTQEIKTEMHCKVCDTAIYPERWTEDIERVFDYQLKAFTPKKASKKLKPLAWVLIGITVLVVACVVGFLVTDKVLA